MNTIELIECTSADIEILRNISIETFSDTFREQNTEENLSHYLESAYNEQKLLEELLNPCSFFFFLNKDQQIIGYLKLNIEEAQTEEITKNSLEVERIYIRKPFLRKGFGKYFIHTAESLAKKMGKDSIWLGVWEYNFNAIKFYEKMGFKTIDSHSFYMGDEKQTDLVLLKNM